MDAAVPAVPDSLPLANCYWVLPGELLAGEHPHGATPELTRAAPAAPHSQPASAASST